MLLLLLACRIELGPPEGTVGTATDTPEGEVWIYTSMYQSVIDVLDPLVRERLPGVDPHWFQAGSEKVAQRVEAEWASGGTPACLLMTSDPFWYARLDQQGHLQPYLAPNVLEIDRALVDPQGAWVTSRLSLVVMAANESLVDRPRRFGDLAAPEWKDRVTVPDPLASGTAFTWLAFVVRDHGWPLVDGLARNGLVAAGGNSAVLGRVETRERPVGVLLLENLLAAPGSPAEAVFPEDGAVLVPGPIALTTDCRNPTAAKAIYDLVLSPEGQAVIVGGNMYAALPSMPPPTGAPALDTIPVRTWTPGWVETIMAEQATMKERWTRVGE